MTRTCAYCKGNGYESPGTEDKCPRCKGTGRMNECICGREVADWSDRYCDECAMWRSAEFR